MYFSNPRFLMIIALSFFLFVIFELVLLFHHKLSALDIKKCRIFKLDNAFKIINF